jgi:hypothetical protein
MNSNLEHIDKRLAEQKQLSKEAAENADEKAWKRAEAEIAALTEMRKFYEKGEK